MATKPAVTGIPNPPATQTHKGCCDQFLAGLQQIKQWACTFFQWLFCCKRSEKPLPPARVQSDPQSLPSKPQKTDNGGSVAPPEDVTKKTPSESTSSEPLTAGRRRSAAPPEDTTKKPPSENTSSEPRKDKGETIQPLKASPPFLLQPACAPERVLIQSYCRCLTEMAKKEEGSSFHVNILHNAIVNILVKPEEQFFLLQWLATNDNTVQWLRVICFLPKELQSELIARLAKQDNVDETAVYRTGAGGERLIHDKYLTADKLLPAFTALARKKRSLTYVSNSERFIQEMVLQFCSPIVQKIPKTSIFKLEQNHKDRFTEFCKEAQAKIIITLMNIQRTKDEFSDKHPVFNDRVFPILNALFDLSEYQTPEKRGTSPLAESQATEDYWYGIMAKDVT